jgi:hypothetical protein
MLADSIEQPARRAIGHRGHTVRPQLDHPAQAVPSVGLVLAITD